MSEKKKKEELKKDVTTEEKKETKEAKVNKKDKKAKKDKKSIKEKRAKKRSLKYVETVKDLDRSKLHGLEDAIELVKKTSYSKFDGSIDLSVSLLKKKSAQIVRAMIELPHGRGKKLNVIALDEAKIAEIAKTKKIDFDVAVVTPNLMPKVARIAKILGPKGKMPSPKSGTITNDVDKTIKELEGGKVEIKENDQAIIHQMVGKVSWDNKKLEENIKSVLKVLPKNRLQKITLSATMSPGVKIDLSKI